MATRGRSIVPTQISMPTAEYFKKRILSKYGIFDSNTHIILFKLGLNDTFKVTTLTETYFLRLYRLGWRSKPSIQAELDWILRLKKGNVGVSSPIPDKKGRYIHTVEAAEGRRYAVLFTNAYGKKGLSNNKLITEYGRIVARTHNIADRYPIETRRHDIDMDDMIVRPIQAINEYFPHRKQECDYLEKVCFELGDQITSKLKTTRHFYGLCHGDHHGGNLHVDEDGKITLFDFDCCGNGWRSYDISVFLWVQGNRRDWSAKTKSLRTRKWNQFLKGYTAVRSLEPEEIECAYAWAPIRHIWVLGLNIQGANDWGSMWMNDSLFDHFYNFVKNWTEQYKLL